MDKSPLSFSIVIEWENAITAGNERARKMLTELRKQILELKGVGAKILTKGEDAYLSRFQFPVNVIISFDKHEVTEEDLTRFARNILPERDDFINLKISASNLQGYYGLKVNGINHSNADVIILLDSDVIPKKKWLQNMLNAFSNKRVDVVFGNTYIDQNSLYGKAFALGWFYPTRSDMSDLEATDGSYIHVNNIAYRKEILDSFPFPLPDGGQRGLCARQMAELRNAGIPIYYNHKAKMGHPAPKWFNHFMNRAIGEGRDAYLNAKYSYESLQQDPEAITAHGTDITEIKIPLSIRSIKKGLGRLSNIFKHREKVNLSIAAAPFAVAIMTLYYGLYALGNISTRLFPRLLKRIHF